MAGEELLGTAIWTSGLEDENSSFNVDFTGKVDASTVLSVTDADSNNGTYSGALAWNGTVTTAYAYYSSLSDLTDMYIRAYVKFGTGYASTARYDEHKWLQLYDGATEVLRCAVNSDHATDRTQFHWRITERTGGATTIYEGAEGEVAANTWYRVEFHWVSDASVGGAQFWLDGVSKGSNFTKNTSSVAVDTFRIGATAGQAWANGSVFYFDDIRVDDEAIGAYVPPAAGGNPAMIYAQQ